MHQELRGFLLQCADAAHRAPLADGVDPRNADRIRAGAEAFDAAVRDASPLAFEPDQLPIARTLGDAGTALGAAFRTVASQLPWTLSPRRHDLVGTDTGMIDFTTVFDLDSLVAGMMVLAPGARYPEHEHPPQELYLVLDGAGSWRHGGATTYVDVAPGTTLYNNPGDRHGAVSGAEPLVAMYVLWEGDPT